jgi:hypothetical protein
VVAYASNASPATPNTPDTVTQQTGQGTGSLNAEVERGTYPAVSGAPCGESGYQFAWVAPSGHLTVTSPHGPVDTGLLVQPDTSPAVVDESGGNYEVAVNGPGDDLWIYTDGGAASTNVAIAPGTSPAGAPNGANGAQFVWQGSGGSLMKTTPSGPQALPLAGVTVAPYTSPSITYLGANCTGGDCYVVAFQGSDHYLWTAGVAYQPSFVAARFLGGVPMDAATSPTITLEPTPGGVVNNGNPFWMAAYTAQDGDVIVAQSHLGNCTDVTAATGVSALGISGPAIAATPGGGFVVAFQDNHLTDRVATAVPEVTGSGDILPVVTGITPGGGPMVSAPTIAALTS